MAEAPGFRLIDAMSQSRNNSLIGVASLCGGVLIFSMQDAILKGMSGDHAVTLAIVLRSIVGVPLLLAMVAYTNGLGALKTRRWKLLIARGLILLTSYTSYYIAFPALPLAEAVALFFTSPIFVTILAAAFLREKVSWKSWGAVIAGFVGVLIILRPGSGLFEPAALLSLLSAAAYALSMVLARRYSADESTTVMAFYVNGVYMVAAAGVALVFHLLGITQAAHPSLEFLVRPWAMPNLTDLALMGLCGVIAALGMTLLTHAYRLARANLVTVFEYTGMLWVPLWGFLFLP